MSHLYFNMLAAVDVETTGLQAGYHDIVQVCVLPLSQTFQPLDGVLPFVADLKPKRPQNMDKRAMKVHMKNEANALIAADAADLFDAWFRTLPIPEGRKLAPLAHNWPFDRGFLIDWLGPHHFDMYFHHRYRDLMAAAMTINDIVAFHLHRFPFSGMTLGEICHKLGVKNVKAHDALGDCAATAACYRELLRQGGGDVIHHRVEE